MSVHSPLLPPAAEEARLAAAEAAGARGERERAKLMIKETGSIAQITVEANMPLPSGEEEEEAAPVDSLASDGQHEAVHLVPLPSGALTKETNDEKLAAAAEEEARLAAQTTVLLGELDSWATGGDNWENENKQNPNY